MEHVWKQGYPAIQHIKLLVVFSLHFYVIFLNSYAVKKPDVATAPKLPCTWKRGLAAAEAPPGPTPVVSTPPSSWISSVTYFWIKNSQKILPWHLFWSMWWSAHQLNAYSSKIWMQKQRNTDLLDVLNLLIQPCCTIVTSSIWSSNVSVLLCLNLKP